MWKKVFLLALFLVTATASVAQPDSRQLERELQRMPWPQFRSIIESIPKLKADIEVHGQLGWAYVQANYKTHRWHKNIDKLDAMQRQQLLELMQASSKGKPAVRRGPSPGP